MDVLPPLRTEFKASGQALGRPTKSGRAIEGRIRELSEQLDCAGAAQRSALCELALLSSCSMSACIAVANARLEARLAQVLESTRDSMVLCWAMAVLSNIADDRASRDRQHVTISALCSLICSTDPEVQHAAALHLATLSRSASLQAAISKNAVTLNSLHAIEGKESQSLSSPNARSLQREAAQYARWALRTPHGRNHKPLFKPKTQDEVKAKASVTVQKHMRRKHASNSYSAEVERRRQMATQIQAHYRGHAGRTALKLRLQEEAPAAAMVQAAIRGRLVREATVKAVSDSIPPNLVDGSPAEISETLELLLHCTDGDMPLTLSMHSAPRTAEGEPAEEAETSSIEEERTTCSLGIDTCSGGVPVLLELSIATAANRTTSKAEAFTMPVNIFTCEGTHVPLLLRLPPIS